MLKNKTFGLRGASRGRWAAACQSGYHCRSQPVGWWHFQPLWSRCSTLALADLVEQMLYYSRQRKGQTQASQSSSVFLWICLDNLACLRISTWTVPWWLEFGGLEYLVQHATRLSGVNLGLPAKLENFVKLNLLSKNVCNNTILIGRFFTSGCAVFIKAIISHMQFQGHRVLQGPSKLSVGHTQSVFELNRESIFMTSPVLKRRIMQT